MATSNGSIDPNVFPLRQKLIALHQRSFNHFSDLAAEILTVMEASTEERDPELESIYRHAMNAARRHDELKDALVKSPIAMLRRLK